MIKNGPVSEIELNQYGEIAALFLALWLHSFSPLSSSIVPSFCFLRVLFPALRRHLWKNSFIRWCLESALPGAAARSRQPVSEARNARNIC